MLVIIINQNNHCRIIIIWRQRRRLWWQRPRLGSSGVGEGERLFLKITLFVIIIQIINYCVSIVV